jgi:hypothetical protein
MRRVRRRALELVLELREQRGHLRHARVQRLVLGVQLRELGLVGAPRTRTSYGRILPGTEINILYSIIHSLFRQDPQFGSISFVLF